MCRLLYYHKDSILNMVCTCRLAKFGNPAGVRPHLKLSEISTISVRPIKRVNYCIAGKFGGH